MKAVLASVLVIALLAGCFVLGYVGIRYRVLGEPPADALDDIVDDLHLR